MEPPSPRHILRVHASPITCLQVSFDNRRLLSGDASGLAAVTSTVTIRPILKWKAHTESLLGIEEWGNRIITHGRDNKLHLWKPEEQPAQVGDSATAPGLHTPHLVFSLDVNALNYCRFSLLPDGGTTLLAVPNLVESSEADVWSIPSGQRIHAAVGRLKSAPLLSSDSRGGSDTGILMALHLYENTNHSETTNDLHLLSASESGDVILRRFIATEKQTSVEGAGWDVVWKTRIHKEAIMAMSVSRDNRFALTVSADHIIGRYDLTSESPESAIAHRMKHAGNSCVAIRDDSRICATGGWDGKIRLYSTKTFKPLGSLSYHKQTCQTVVFAHQVPENDSQDDDIASEDKEVRSRWLVAGGKDGRISLWELMNFEKPR